MAATLYVCTTCRGQPPEQICADRAEAAAPVANSSQDPEAVRPGALLHAALAAQDCPEGVTIIGVECLSACSQGCAVALGAPGKWSYVYGRLAPIDAEEILDGASRYAASADGLVPWRERPQIFRKQSLARIPPLPSDPQE